MPLYVARRPGSCLSTRAGTSCATNSVVNPAATAAAIQHATIHCPGRIPFSGFHWNLFVLNCTCFAAIDSTYRDFLLAGDHRFSFWLRIWGGMRPGGDVLDLYGGLPRRRPRLATAYAARAVYEGSRKTHRPPAPAPSAPIALLSPGSKTSSNMSE